MKRIAPIIISILLLFALTLPCFAFVETNGGVKVEFAFADEEKTIPLCDENGKQALIVIGYNDDMPTIRIPETVEMYDGDYYTVMYIAKYAFSQNENVTKAIIADTVVEIGQSAFEGCDNLMKVTLPKGLKTLGMSTFRDCRLLRSIKLPDTLEKIDDFCFEGCTMLRTLKIPASVNEIGHHAFSKSESLILDVSKNEYAESYAVENMIRHEFIGSPEHTMLIVVINTAVLGAAVIAASLIIKRIKKKKAK